MNVKCCRRNLLLLTLALFLLIVGCGSKGQVVKEDEGTDIVWPSTFVFEDDFMDDLDRWETIGGSWKVGNGILRQTNRRIAEEGEGFVFLLVEDVPVSDYRIEVDIRFSEGRANQRFAGIVFRYLDPFNFLSYRLCDFRHFDDRIEIYEYLQGQRQIKVDHENLAINPLQWRRFAVEAIGPEISAYLDGELVLRTMNADLMSGRVGLATKGAKAEFRNFKVMEL